MADQDSTKRVMSIRDLFPDQESNPMPMLTKAGLMSPISSPNFGQPIAPSPIGAFSVPDRLTSDAIPATGVNPGSIATFPTISGPAAPSTAAISNKPVPSRLDRFGKIVGEIGKGVGSAIGQAVAPWAVPFIPGTIQHDQIKQAREQEQEQFGTEQAQRQATTEHEKAGTQYQQAETSAIPARTAMEEARTEAEKSRADAETAREKREAAAAGKPQIISTDKGLFELVPTDKGYEIRPAQTPTGEPLMPPQKPVSVAPGGSLVDTITGKTIFTAPQKEATGFQEETYQQEKKQNPNLTREQFIENRENRSAEHQAEAQARAFSHQEEMEKNRENFQNAKQDALTNSTKTMIEAAPNVKKFVDRINTLIDQQKDQLGPAAGRWSELMAGKVGSPNPEFTKLRTDVGLLQTLLMRMHVGSRGGEYIMKHFQDLIDSGKQSPENLKASLEEIGTYADQILAERKGSSKESPASKPAGGGFFEKHGGGSFGNP